MVRNTVLTRERRATSSARPSADGQLQEQRHGDDQRGVPDGRRESGVADKNLIVAQADPSRRQRSRSSGRSCTQPASSIGSATNVVNRMMAGRAACRRRRGAPPHRRVRAAQALRRERRRAARLRQLSARGSQASWISRPTSFGAMRPAARSWEASLTTRPVEGRASVVEISARSSPSAAPPPARGRSDSQRFAGALGHRDVEAVLRRSRCTSRLL